MDDPEFKKLEAMLLELQESKVPPGKLQIVNITKQALAAVRHFKHVVHAVEKFIMKSKSSHKLHGFYMIDSIVRQSQKKFKHKDLFKPRFAANLKQTLENALKCPLKDRAKIVRVINLWRANNIFDDELLLSLLQYCRASGLSIDVESVEKAVKGENADLTLYKTINESDHSQVASVKPSSSQISQQQQVKTSSSNASLPLISESVLVKHLSVISSDYQKAFAGNPDVLLKVQAFITEKVKQKLDSESKNKIQSILSAGFDYSDEEDFDEEENRGAEPTSKEKIEKLTESILKESNVQSELRKIFLQQVGVSSNDKDTRNGREDSKERKRRRSDRSTSRDRDRRDSKDGKRDRHRRSKEKSHKRRSSSPRHKDDKRERERRKLGWPLEPKREHLLMSSRTIWLGKIPANCSESEIKAALADIGMPDKINIMNSRACAYVTMPDRRSAYKVVDRMAHKLEISRKPVKVSWSIGQGLNGNKQLNVFWEPEFGYHQIPWTSLREPIDPYFEGSYADVDTLPRHLRGLYDEKGRKRVKQPEKHQPPPQPNIATVLPPDIPMPLPETAVIPNVGQLPPGFPAGLLPPGLVMPDVQDGNNQVNMEMLMSAVANNANAGILGAPPQLNAALLNSLNVFNHQQQQLNQNARFPRHDSPLPDQQSAFNQFRGGAPRFPNNDFGGGFGQRPFSPRHRGGFNGTPNTRFNMPNLNQPPPNIADLSGKPMRFNGPPPTSIQNAAVRPQIMSMNQNFAQLPPNFNTLVPPPSLSAHAASEEPMDIASPDGPPGI